MMCALELGAQHAEEQNLTERKRLVNDVIAHVARYLGNTPAVCRKAYIYPGVIQEFLDRGALELVARVVEKTSSHALERAETAVVTLIRRIVARANQPLAKALDESVRVERARRKKSAHSTASRKAA